MPERRLRSFVIQIFVSIGLVIIFVKGVLDTGPTIGGPGFSTASPQQPWERWLRWGLLAFSILLLAGNCCAALRIWYQRRDMAIGAPRTENDEKE